MELLEHTLFINLNHRTDRLEHINAEFEKMGIKAERVEGVQPKSPAIGCTMSHIKCLELAKTRGYEQVFICEDDITFTNPDLFKEQIEKFAENDNINWDVLIISGNNRPPCQKLYEYAARVFYCQTTTGYVVKKEYYDTMLANFKEGLLHLIKNPTNKFDYAIDKYWQKLQMQDYWYIITPLSVIQYDNYSDIENKDTKYSEIMLDLDKEWFVRQQELKKWGLMNISQKK
jgi:GR25 family glycosyltransferase involved in LPS biosynthesis